MGLSRIGPASIKEVNLRVFKKNKYQTLDFVHVEVLNVNSYKNRNCALLLTVCFKS